MGVWLGCHMQCTLWYQEICFCRAPTDGCLLDWGDRTGKGGADTFREQRAVNKVVREDWIDKWESTERFEADMAEHYKDEMAELLVEMEWRGKGRRRERRRCTGRKWWRKWKWRGRRARSGKN